MITIGDRIRTIRKNSKMTQIEFAELLGVSQGSLSELEQDKYKPSVDVLIVLITRLNVKLEWLLLGTLFDEQEDLFNIHLIENEVELITLFRKLRTSDQVEILDFLKIKIHRYKK